MPWVEGVESDDVHGFLGEVGGVLFEHGGQVFVVGEGHLEVVESAIFGVDSEFGTHHGVLTVGVFFLEAEICENAVFVVLATDGEDVAHH